MKQLVETNDPLILSKVNKYLRQIEIENAKDNLYSFVKLFWNYAATNPLQDGWYLSAICDHLQACIQGKLTRLIISCPPRSGKSIITNVMLPSWAWIKYPELKFMCASYSLSNLSQRDSIMCRGIIKSSLYQSYYGDSFKLLKDQDTKTKFTNNKLGFRYATSTDSANTGEGGSVIVIDDPISVTDVQSQAERQNVIDWFCRTMSSRLNPGSLDVKIIIAQRCHEDDLTGYILKNNLGNWEHLILPYEYDPDRKCKTLLWVDPRKEKGEALHTLLTPEKVVELKSGNGLGVRGFECQYNQRVISDDGGVFNAAWFKRFKVKNGVYYLNDDQIERHNLSVFVTVDPAISLKQEADWTVAQIWGRSPDGRMLLLDMFRDKKESPDLIKKFLEIQARWRPQQFIVEDVLFSRLFIQLMREKSIPTSGIKPEGLDKLARCRRFQAMAESGFIFLPEQASWIDDFYNELLSFPLGSHDDIVDCCSYAALFARGMPIVTLPKKEIPVTQTEQNFMWKDL